MKIYVASKWENKDRVRVIMALLKAVGHTITHDWTSAELVSLQQAVLDLRGVEDSDVFVGIFEDDVMYNGSLVELGAALALGKPIYLIGDAPVIDRCIFTRHPNVHLGYNIFMKDLLS